MFREIQTLVRLSQSIQDGVGQTIRFARNNPGEYDSNYWKKMESRFAQLPLNSVMSWSKEGLSALSQGTSWDCLILDLGDCPEIFALNAIGRHLNEKKTRQVIFRESLFSADELESCIIGDNLNSLWDWRMNQLVYHNVRELKDRILSWNTGKSVDYNGNNGYLAWLAMGSLALIEPFRKPAYCKRILRGRRKIYLLTGFEEIFFYLATVTEKGIVFEKVRNV